MQPLSEQLYELLPAVHRVRDAENDGVLQKLLQIIGEQVGLVEENIGQLYDDWFIETCEEWLVPYIGDLLGVRGLNQIQDTGFTMRARVANTLAYRRRKGTAAMLEQLARDTTLWPAHVVEYFELLGTTQYLNHLRPANVRTPDLRQVDALALVDSPFDRCGHTADVRRISGNRAAAIGRGRHNIRNIGIFLWRLQSYTLTAATPQPAGTGLDGGFTFSPLGNPLPLFHQPKTETTITHLSTEADLPAAIRPLAFLRDLQANAVRSLALPPASQPTRSAYYGPGASLNITRGGQPISPLDIACMDLSAWDRPPIRVSGLLSGELADHLNALSHNPPSIDITIGAEGPHTAVLADMPTTPSEAANLLGQAIRQAHASAAFSRAQVALVGKRLLILPGQAGRTLTLAHSPTDTATLDELRLDAPVALEAALSSPLKPFPVLFPGRMQVTIGGLGPRGLNLAPMPATLADAQQRLEAVIQAAGAEPDFQEARVLVVDDRLLIVPGVTGGGASAGPVVFDTDLTDTSTLYRLGLNPRVGVDVALGRLIFPVGDPAADIRVTYSYGFSGDLGGGPYDRRYLRKPREPQPSAYANSVASPRDVGAYLRVPDDFASLTLAVDNWKNVLNGPSAVIEMTDNRTYVEDLTLEVGPADLVIQAANQCRPALIGDLVVTGSGHGRLALNGLLMAGTLTIPDGASVRQLDLVHSTLVPGRRLEADGRASQPDTPSLVVGSADPDLALRLERSICGPIQAPPEIAGLTATDCIIESPLRGQPGFLTPALVSGAVNNVNLSATTPELLVTIGEEGPYPLSLLPKPATIAQARDRLEAALHGLNKGPAFDLAHVFSVGTHLIVLPGVASTVSFDALAADQTVVELRLDRAQAEGRVALLSGPVSGLPISAAISPVLLELDGVEATVNLPASATLAQVRDNMQNAIRSANANPAFAAAMVASLASEKLLVVVPGTPTAVARFKPAPGEAATLENLALASDHFAIAASPGGELPAPSTTLQRTTVLGRVHVKTLELGSECIFTGQVRAARRQAGCVRFSFVPPGSRTPVRFRCQPDLEVSTQTDALSANTPAAVQALTQSIQGWLRPAFMSTRYGSPAYGQLSQTCPLQIRTGAEDGSEMGAFSFLKQPQREKNLRLSLDEYLRLGLDAGIFFVS